MSSPSAAADPADAAAAPSVPAANPPAPPAHATPLHGSALLLGTLSLSLATFMNVLDSSIANVSLPSISGNLGVSTSQGTWVITSFGVANAISVPLTGWLTQRFGAVRLFTASVLLFVLASWLCGLAPSIEMLIGFRVLQGNSIYNCPDHLKGVGRLWLAVQIFFPKAVSKRNHFRCNDLLIRQGFVVDFLRTEVCRQVKFEFFGENFNFW